MSEADQMTEAAQTPRDLLEIQSAMDRLAGAERRSAREGLEDRVFAASRGALAAPAPIRFPSAGRWRLAAGLVLIAGAGLAASAWLVMRGGSTGPVVTPPIALEVTPIGDGLDAEELRGELEDLFASYDAVEEADLADSTPMSETFWGDDAGLTKEDPIQ